MKKEENEVKIKRRRKQKEGKMMNGRIEDDRDRQIESYTYRR
jgi:hypothetical protein